MTARFILSLDCEGKWGVADHLDRGVHTALTDARLRDAYRQLTDLLDEFSVPATFAFVGCFAEEESGLRRLMPRLRGLEAVAPGYLGPALKDMSDGSREGWHGQWAVELVGAARTPHEIALHGVTHIPWTDLDGRAAREELALLAEMETPVRHARTFVYPRNKVAHLDALAAAGIAGFRLGTSTRSRFASLISEFNIFSKPEADPGPGSGVMAIPGGFFVNWQSGLRRAVPKEVSLLRAKRLLDVADRTDRVVHYWMHPENIATAPATLDLLRGIIELVSRRRDAGRCQPLAQIGYIKDFPRI